MWRKEVMKTLKCSISSVRRWTQEGKLRYTDVPDKNGVTFRRMYWDEDVWHLVGKKYHKEHMICLYARVNKKTIASQEKMLAQQRLCYEWATAKGLKITKVYEDWAISVDFSVMSRPGLHSLIEDVIKKKVDIIIVETRDRLGRVGWDLCRDIFKYFGVELLIVNEVIHDPFYREEQEDDLAYILEQAKVDRVGALSGSKPKPPAKTFATHKGKITPNWEGQPEGDLSDLM
jgi:predicted site-specific integrase-resolvase